MDQFTYRILYRPLHSDDIEIEFATGVSADYVTGVLESDAVKKDADREWWAERSPVHTWTRVTLDDVIADGG